MGYVYLIGEINEGKRYKIGSTRAKDINKRLKQLQTGNSNPLFLESFYQTDKPFKLETMLHNKFKDNNVIGEWFEMKDDDIKSFHEVCSKFQNIINSLKENPYF
jgi:hypothetical protein